jgi:hypothetical protein
MLAATPGVRVRWGGSTGGGSGEQGWKRQSIRETSWDDEPAELYIQCSLRWHSFGINTLVCGGNNKSGPDRGQCHPGVRTYILFPRAGLIHPVHIGSTSCHFYVHYIPFGTRDPPPSGQELIPHQISPVSRAVVTTREFLDRLSR